ncbi:Ger(x)C family spore germination protein [Bacillus infantis]|uniref:Ger(X)C family spore germination protein n=1 Tax=Bacillus infantis TaxID=324767 RepID=A0A5D4RH56_9BACI|nr:Ger(x)C family spore germination protein [Bacillus infantis]TYS50149.1 Ger(x)C family spore germination protein [Bacillus infantis]
MKLSSCLSLIAVCMLLTGCLEKEIIDDLNIESGIAYDWEDNKLKGTALIPVYLPDQPVKNVTFTSTSTLSRDLLLEMQRQSSEPLVTGSLEVGVFGKELTQRGIIDVLDSFQRDASIGARVFLAVADNKAGDIMKGEYGTRGNAIYISNLLKHNMEQRDVPKSNLQIFLASFYQQGKTAYLPKLKEMGKDKVEIAGMSLFKFDKVVDEIDAEKMFFFKLLVDKYSEGSYKIKIGNDQASIKSIKSKHKIKIDKREPYELKVEINIKGIIREYSGKQLTIKEIKGVEKNFENLIDRETEALITRFQKEGIDPVGIGALVKSKTRGFDFKKWEDEYKRMSVKVTSNVEILESGVIE